MNVIKFSTSLIATILAMAIHTACAEQAAGSYTVQYTGGTIPLWDISGSYSESTGPLELDYTLTQDPAGKFTGSGDFSYYEYYGGYSLSLDSGMNLTGSIKTSGSTTRVALTATGAGDGYVAGYYCTFTYSLKENCEMDGYGGLVGTVSGRVNVTVPELHRSKGAAIPATDFATWLPVGASGDWSVTLNLTPNGTKYTGTATAQTSTGMTTDFTVTGTYSAKTDTSKLSLKGVGGNLSLTAKTAGVNLIVQALKGKLMGQTLTQTAP